MNPFELNVLQIRIEAPLTRILRASELDQYMEARACIARSRLRAAAVLRHARKTSARIVAEAKEKAEDTAARAERLAREGREQIYSSARDEAVEGAVEWLVQEQEMEVAILRRLEGQCREILVDVLSEFAGEYNHADLVQKRVELHMKMLSGQGALTMRLHKDDLKHVASSFGDGCKMAFVADESVPQGIALIDSPLVRLHIDVSRHLAHLIEQLRFGAEKVK